MSKIKPLDQYLLVFIISLLCLLFISTGISSLAYKSVTEESISDKFKVAKDCRQNLGLPKTLLQTTKNKNKKINNNMDLPCILVFYDIRHREENKRYHHFSIFNKNYDNREKEFKNEKMVISAFGGHKNFPSRRICPNAHPKDRSSKSKFRAVVDELSQKSDLDLVALAKNSLAHSLLNENTRNTMKNRLQRTKSLFVATENFSSNFLVGAKKDLVSLESTDNKIEIKGNFDNFFVGFQDPVFEIKVNLTCSTFEKSCLTTASETEYFGT